MDPVLANLISSIGIEAVKIVGPAMVAALAAYKAAALQFKATLQQLQEANEFSARQHLFDYYKERQKRFSEGHEKLMNSLAQILGMRAGAAGDDSEESLKAIIDTIDALTQLHLGTAPFEIDLVVRDMKAKKLDGLEECRELQAKKSRLAGLSVGSDFESMKNVVFNLIDVYSALERCNQLLLEREMDTLFSKYVGQRTWQTHQLRAFAA